MKDKSLTITKILPPSHDSIVVRTRLIEKLEQYRDKKLLLVTGQAAQGKSTLIASYMKDKPCAWVNLESEDSDPISLCNLILQSLWLMNGNDDPFPELAVSDLNLMFDGQDKVLYRSMLNALYGYLPEVAFLVLDGLDRLSPDSVIFDLLQELINSLSPHLKVVMLSRQMPNLKLQALKVRRELAVITNEELAFSEDETAELFCQIKGFEVSASQLKRIHQISEGWIGGLILISYVIGRKSLEDRDLFISEELSERFKNEVFQYLDEEILGCLPRQEQNFLLKSSIFTDLDPIFLQDLSGMEKAVDLLHEFKLRNLFIYAVYDETSKNWKYRYHNLIRDFLYRKYSAKTQKDERWKLVVEAGRLYEKRGELESAARFYLKGHAYKQAASVLQTIGRTLVEQRRREDLRNMLHDIPSDLIVVDPWLMYYLAETKRFNDYRSFIELVEQAYLLFEDQGNLQGQLLLLSEQLYSCDLGYETMPLPELLKRSDDLLSRSEGMQYPFERARLLLYMGFNLTLRGSDPRKGVRLCRESFLLAENIGVDTIQIIALCYIIRGCGQVGEFDQAEETSEQLKAISRKIDAPDFKALEMTCRLTFYLNEGDMMRANEVIRIARAEVQRYGITYENHIVSLHEIMYKRYAGEFDDALEIARLVLPYTKSINNVFIQGQVLMEIGMIDYFREDLHQSLKSLRQAEKIFSSPRFCSDIDLYMIKVALGLILSRMGDSTGILNAMSEVLHYSYSVDNYIMIIETHLALALMIWRKGDSEGVLHHLQAGFSIAEERGYDHFNILSKRDAACVCALTLELNDTKSQEYARFLLVHRFSDMGIKELERFKCGFDHATREKAEEILCTIHRKNVPRLSIRTLGRFQVWRGNIPIDEKEWKRNQPKNLLKALIAHGARRVPKDVLMEDIWPESDLMTQERNFKVILHWLRKILEPEMSKEFGSSYIYIKGNLLSLDETMVEIDCENFEDLLTRADEIHAPDDQDSLRTLLETAMNIYRGDFLPDDIYASWAESRRVVMNRRAVWSLYKLAELYEKNETCDKVLTCYMRCMEIDPYQEEAYRRLMQFLWLQGRINQAIMVFEECRKNLITGLDTEPEDATLKIYHEILKHSRNRYHKSDSF